MLTVYDKNGYITSDNLLSAKLVILVNPTSEELTNIEKTIGCDAHVFTKQTSANVKLKMPEFSYPLILTLVKLKLKMRFIPQLRSSILSN